MKRIVSPLLLIVCLIPLCSNAQLDKIVIPAGTPEDQALQAITNEQDAQKKLAMYEDFLQKFSSNPAAVAYGNWQISQYYQTAGDLPKALDYGDKALASSPHNLDILVSQANVAQQMKNNEKVVEYAARGGEIYNSLDKQPRPEGMSEEQFQSHVADVQASAKSSYEFLEAAAYNAIVDENDAQKRMAYIERFTPAFPKSRFEDGIASYAMVALQQLKDTPRLLVYGEKSLQANPNSLPTLLLMANAYVDDPKPGSVGKAITYSQKVIEIAKADAPDADKSRKLSAGLAHSTLGYAYMKEDKTAASVPELKSACELLRGQDDQSFSIAAYRLGFAYGKLNKIAEAKEILNEAVKIQGPVQQPARELLEKVNAAKPRRSRK
jgi:tetratricopeptide (TPR) repeat protein